MRMVWKLSPPSRADQIFQQMTNRSENLPDLSEKRKQKKVQLPEKGLADPAFWLSPIVLHWREKRGQKSWKKPDLKRKSVTSLTSTSPGGRAKSRRSSSQGASKTRLTSSTGRSFSPSASRALGENLT
jgi:hypothetical protein